MARETFLPVLPRAAVRKEGSFLPLGGQQSLLPGCCCWPPSLRPAGSQAVLLNRVEPQKQAGRVAKTVYGCLYSVEAARGIPGVD